MEINSAQALFCTEVLFAPSPVTETPLPETTKALVEYFDSCWNLDTKSFKPMSFPREEIADQFVNHHQQFPVKHDLKRERGFIEKRDLQPGSKVFVRADLHGDLKSLLENVKTLKKEGLLDDDYKCKKDVQLVFLGDYVDRGEQNLETLVLLMRLHSENPQNVTLIRGNHEDITLNTMYSNNDPAFEFFVGEHSELLEAFYNSMPLTLYLAQEGEEREYVQFTHGTFEPKVDPYSILKSDKQTKTTLIPKFTLYSSRVNTFLSRGSSKQKNAIIRIRSLVNSGVPLQNSTPYCWGDMGDKSSFGAAGARQWIITPNDVKNYFCMFGGKHKVKFLFRGHQHEKQHFQYDGKKEKKTIVSTMPVGMDCPAYKNTFNQQDTGYILTVAPEVKNWTKKAYLRDSGSSDVTITEAYPIRDVTI